jgi:hypothetical protein
VRLHHWLLWSPAYRDLRPVERALLVEMYALYDGFNNGSLFLSEREAGRRLGVHRETARAALASLEEHGFIRARQRSSFDWKLRKATTWVLTEFACDGLLPTKDFMRWSTQNKNAGRKICPDGTKFPSISPTEIPSGDEKPDLSDIACHFDGAENTSTVS